MRKTEATEDVSTIFFLLPFLASGVYALYLWVRNGVTLVLPSSVYLSVTRDPYVFLLGAAGVMGGLLLQVATTETQSRRAKVSSLSGTLQKIAAASFVLALISALYSNSFSISGAATDFVVGRYSIVFPVMLVVLSYLIVTPFSSGGLGRRQLLGIAFMIMVPPVLYEVGKRNVLVGLFSSFGLLILGAITFLWNRPKSAPSAQTQAA